MSFARAAALPLAALGGMVAMTLLVCVAPLPEVLGLAAVVAGSVALYAVMRGLAARA